MVKEKNVNGSEAARQAQSLQKKRRLGLIFGGESAEHEVSIQSAKAIIEHLDPEKYLLIPIGIDKKGEWHFFAQSPFFNSLKQESAPTFKKQDRQCFLLFNQTLVQKKIFSPSFFQHNLDVVFPVLHGPLGEDGAIQGFLELANLPYVGSDLMSSAICMDKGMMKEILRAKGLPTPRYLTLNFNDKIDEKKIIESVALPLFVKPTRMGSSIGVSRVSHLSALFPAIQKAFQFDEKILVEECIDGREIECSVLGNENPEASLPGEVIPRHPFYSYEAKYLDENGADFVIPAQIDQEKIDEVKKLAIQAFQILGCAGMARVDFFLKKDGSFLINELNTIPGFTSISLYPRLWEVSGLSYSHLLDRLIELSIVRYERKKQFRRGIGNWEGSF